MQRNPKNIPVGILFASTDSEDAIKPEKNILSLEEEKNILLPADSNNANRREGVQGKNDKNQLNVKENSFKTQEECSSPLSVSDFHVVMREDKKEQIRHMEFYTKWEKGGEETDFAQFVCVL